MEYKEGDIVLATVEQVTNTITFVTLPDGSKGTIISSEIAPGRIKFMRAYVVPKKKIVCKVLRISGDRIDLSLRRVNQKEKKQVLLEFKQCLAIKTALKQILKDEYPKIENKILQNFKTLNEFLEQTKENPALIEKYIPKQHQEQIEKLNQKKCKEVEVKYTIKTKCLESDGIKKIKEIFDIKNDKIKIVYIAAGKFILKLTTTDFKSGKKEIQEIITKLEENAKKRNCEIEFKEEK